eukprot:5623818-Pyramimonas_sp.AAC.1
MPELGLLPELEPTNDSCPFFSPTSSFMKPRPRARGMRDCRARFPFMCIVRKLYEFPAQENLGSGSPWPR